MAELTQFLLDGKGQLEGQIKINPRRELLDPDILPYPVRDLL